MKLNILKILTAIVIVAGAVIFNAAPVFAAAINKVAVGTKGSDIAYDKTKLSAKKGSVEITFTNKASVDSSMPHNLVLLKPGSSVEDVAAAAITAGAAKNYLPDSPAILKATSMLNPGQSEKITVDLEPGVYPFFCSYPGHAALMNGTLTIK